MKSKRTGYGSIRCTISRPSRPPGLRLGRVEISGGFLLLAALLYYLDTGGALLWTGVACALHELAHYGAIRLWGGGVSALRISCVGAEMTLSARRPLSRWGEIAAALAGPGANLLLALGASRLAPRLGEALYLFSGINLALAVFNLLPIARLDGGRALRGLLSLVRGEEEAGHLARVSSLAVSAALALGSILLLARGQASFTLVITAVWLLAASLRE